MTCRELIETLGSISTYRFSKVYPNNALRLTDFGKQACGIKIDSGNHTTLSALISKVRCKCTSVNAANSYNILALEVFRQTLRAAPVRRGKTHFVYYKSAKSQGISLQVVEIHTVISDLRIGHGDDLTSIRRVRNDLKIAFK